MSIQAHRSIKNEKNDCNYESCALYEHEPRRECQCRIVCAG